MTYAEVVAADNPAHWWRCDEPGSTATLWDSTAGTPRPVFDANSHSQAQCGYGGPGAGAMFVYQAFTPGFELGDLDQLLPAGAAFTLELWWWVWGYPTAQPAWLMGAGDSGTDYWQLLCATDGKLRYLNVAGGVATTINQPATVTLRAWNHCVLAHTGSHAYLWLDASTLADAACSSPGATGQAFAVMGPHSASFKSPKGFTAEAAIYHSYLDITAITAHYDAANRSAAPRLITATGDLGDDRLGQILASVRRTYS